MNKLFSALPLWQPQGLAIIRIIVGSFLIYHGWEVFDAAKIKEYTTWDIFKNSSSPSFKVYMGKTAELVEGFLLVLGLITRLVSVAIMFTFLYITFFVGQGKIWYEDQYPFLFVLLALVFFFTGPGNWSVDQVILKRRTEDKLES
jgi:putative oxidoreductase